MKNNTDLREQLFAGQDWFADLVAAVPDEQLGLPTPCAEFDVRKLIAHTSAVLDKIAAFAIKGRDPYATDDPEYWEAQVEHIATQRVDSHTPAQRAELLRMATSQARAAWTDDRMDMTVELSWGPVLPLHEVAALYLMEVLLHAWDLAMATGQVAEAPGNLGEVGLAAAHTWLPEQPRGMAEGIPFEPVIASVPDAGPTEQMANWAGRVSR